MAVGGRSISSIASPPASLMKTTCSAGRPPVWQCSSPGRCLHGTLPAGDTPDVVLVCSLWEGNSVTHHAECKSGTRGNQRSRILRNARAVNERRMPSRRRWLSVMLRSQGRRLQRWQLKPAWNGPESGHAVDQHRLEISPLPRETTHNRHD